MKKIFLVISFVIAILIAMPTAGISQLEKEVKIFKKLEPMGERVEIDEDIIFKPPLFIDKLKLTEDQEKQFRKLRLEMEKKQIDARAKIKNANIELKELFIADNLDRTAIEKKIKEIAELKTKLHLNRLDHWFAVNKILKPEQQKIWKEMLEKKPKMDRIGLQEKIGKMMKGRPFMRHFRNDCEKQCCD